ncbi:MAG: hypothetical protein L0Z49_07305 [Actinobacteria bacterium]|nr:hypothetical protein [Actinomycetota bacterium]
MIGDTPHRDSGPYLGLTPSMRLGRSLAVILLIVGLPNWGAPVGVITRGGYCLEIDHFPDQPIDGAPSIVGLIIRLPPDLGGMELFFEYTGASGDQQGSGPIDDTGVGTAYGPLYQFGPHNVTDVYVEVDNERNPVMPLDETQFTVDSNETTCDPSALAPVAVESTTTTGVSTTTMPEPTTSVAPSTTVTTAPSTPQGTSVWPIVAIVLGSLLLLPGLILLLRPKDPCARLRELWEAAEARARLAAESLEKARQELERRRDLTKDVKAELAELESARGTFITDRGVTYHQIAEGLVTAEGLEELIASHQRRISDAEAAEADAAKSVADWEQRVADLKAAAVEARAAYERCVGEHTPPPPPPPPSPPGPTGPGGPAVVATPQEGSRECVEGDRESRPAGDAQSINVVVDFSLITEIEEGSERKVGEAAVLALDLSSLANELGTLGSLLGAYGAGTAVAGGVRGLRAGEYVEGTAGAVWGGITGYIAGADPNIGTESFPVSIPTSPQEAVTEMLEATSRLGALVAQKVGEWLQMNQLYNLRITYFYQEVTATPFTVWECRAGTWVCIEKVFHVSVSGLKRRPGPRRGPFRLESDLARSRFEREVSTLVGLARSALETSTRAKAEFDQRHRPGPCQ